ncbi:MAG: leucine--tRNA ligase, partial [Candidatus Moranbacteria bacterium]|nr:leucine--tRNA ligase [Candidatus Moranbacteria bacterium]
MEKYDPKSIEHKWQQRWRESGIYEVKDAAEGKENHMLLTEFPYPSGNLHIGHWYAFAVPDILARFLRLRGKNVMYPMGFDAFGLPAENAAIKHGLNPRAWTEKNIAHMTEQFATMGASIDWSRQVSTIDPDYYKWTQWIFLKMFEKGLAYRKEVTVNWCPSCKTVLANEQVTNEGRCERCETEVVQKNLEQWLYKITDYADRLIDDIENLDWPESTKLAQKNWIGRSEGATIKFEIKISNSDGISNFQFPISKQSPNDQISKNYFEVFTTRLDTIFGCTYCVVAPEHPIFENRELRIENREEVEKYISDAKKKTNLERTELQKDKTGVELKGIKAVNPFTNEEVPVFVADYVLATYGTGAVMAVPAHDERDWEFAKKYKLPIKPVVLPRSGSKEVVFDDGESVNPEEIKKILDNGAFTGDGRLINSDDYSGMNSQKAREEMAKWLEENKLGKKEKKYRLHDWVISRQRYWGVPIPVVHCEKCGVVPVPEKDLPIELPDLKDFLPAGDGKSPLAKAEVWVNVKCPQCGGDAKRETDTMDTFVDSSWYFIRYADPKNENKFADEAKMKKWLPVPMYIGGAEHNTMHLLYSRFFTKVLFDLGLVNFSEPFTGRRNHGIILGPDNQKMSKSRGNVVDPDAEVKKYGADSVRMYLAFMGPYDQNASWQMQGVTGTRRFLEKVYNLSEKLKAKSEKPLLKNNNLENLLHKTIKKVTEDIENFRFNTAISAMMILVNEMEKEENIPIASFKLLITILSPFAPHVAEELW